MRPSLIVTLIVLCPVLAAAQTPAPAAQTPPAAPTAAAAALGAQG